MRVPVPFPCLPARLDAGSGRAPALSRIRKRPRPLREAGAVDRAQRVTLGAAPPGPAPRKGGPTATHCGHISQDLSSESGPEGQSTARGAPDRPRSLARTRERVKETQKDAGRKTALRLPARKEGERRVPPDALGTEDRPPPSPRAHHPPGSRCLRPPTHRSAPRHAARRSPRRRGGPPTSGSRHSAWPGSSLMATSAFTKTPPGPERREDPPVEGRLAPERPECDGGRGRRRRHRTRGGDRRTNRTRRRRGSRTAGAGRGPGRASRDRCRPQ